MLYSGRDLRKLIIPLVIEQVLSIAVGMADTIMVSAAGEAAVSGVSLVDTVNILLINVFSALATGGAVVAGHFLGKRKLEEARKAAWQIILFATLLALVISVVFFAAHDQLLHLMFGQIEDDVMRACKTYLMITTSSFVALAVYNSCAALFRAMNNAKVTMWVSLLMNLINVTGNAICIFGLRMGVEGVAIPTTVSRYVAAILIFALMFNPRKEINLCGQLTPRFHGGLIKKILYIAVPNGMENSMFQLGKILVISAVSTMGTASIAANAVANTLANWNCLPGIAINLSIVSVVSVCVGANEYGQARYYTRKLCTYAAVGIAGMSAILYVTAPLIVGVYNLGPEAAGLAEEVIRAHAVMAMLFWVLSFSLPNTLRAAGDVMLPMGISIASMWLFRVVAAYVFTYVFHLGLLAVWGAMFIDWIFRAVCYIVRYRGSRWEKYGQKS
ncbi:MAG: MATE family efflux transporter [Eubacteriales bacterium]|nr:MATE family efflux transporter [Eubacteriales bacterium]